MLDDLVAAARSRWGLDLSAGLQVIVAETLAGTPIEASRPVLIVPATVLGVTAPAATENLPGRHRAGSGDALEVLRRLYPTDHVVGRAEGSSTTIGNLAVADLQFPLFLTPLAPELAAAGPWAMPYISDRLRRPDGCPWDREQTHESLRKHLLEEAYEVYDALEASAGVAPA
ncbi:MAG: hypothetical protein EPO00_10610, partial [Chloroflexota bacterium]